MQSIDDVHLVAQQALNRMQGLESENFQLRAKLDSALAQSGFFRVKLIEIVCDPHNKISAKTKDEVNALLCKMSADKNLDYVTAKLNKLPQDILALMAWLLMIFARLCRR